VTDRLGTEGTGIATPQGARPRGAPPQINTMPRTLPARRAAATLASLLLLGACGGAPEGPVTPGSLGIATGNNQTGVVGTALPATLSVVVRDTKGRLISGQRVDWDVAAGAGTVSPASSRTDASGVAVTTWTLGTTAGVGRVSAQVTGVNPAAFAATILVSLFTPPVPEERLRRFYGLLRTPVGEEENLTCYDDPASTPPVSKLAEEGHSLLIVDLLQLPRRFSWKRYRLDLIGFLLAWLWVILLLLLGYWVTQLGA